MGHSAGLAFTLRLWNNSHWGRLGAVRAAIAATAIAAALSGCTSGSDYPSTANITDLGTILSPEERQKALQDLSKQQQNNEAAKANSKQ